MFFQARPRRDSYGDATPLFHIQSAEVRISFYFKFYMIASAAVVRGYWTACAAGGKSHR